MTPADELADIIAPFGRDLDDTSVAFVARLRARRILTNSDWERVKAWLIEAMEFITGPERTAQRQPDGTTIIDPDADPRNADWLRIAAVHRQAGYRMPMWASLWLWWLRTDSSPEFWRAVGREAAKAGMERYKVA